MEIKQIVEACLMQVQAQPPKKEQSERPRMPQKKLWCWYCGEMGHIMRGCPVIQQDKTGRKDDARRLLQGARWCQMVPKGARLH